MPDLNKITHNYDVKFVVANLQPEGYAILHEHSGFYMLGSVGTVYDDLAPANAALTANPQEGACVIPIRIKVMLQATAEAIDTQGI